MSGTRKLRGLHEKLSKICTNTNGDRLDEVLPQLDEIRDAYRSKGAYHDPESLIADWEDGAKRTHLKQLIQCSPWTWRLEEIMRGRWLRKERAMAPRDV
ncbi:unnamed protein product [Vitrella brassicaformis CCMP3155]|uniref:Uncharacterized protein n=1 Tax=Vitrella brassicaformis (strain CCMP3155) TaxID=1169540 RepID=A0A0G4GZ20_VITBC|nr:unnamed protein product [Vitrella brassicaformis CCMP3155]|eukprot:CEM36413.1 unnamed protein product [Vitrella brassicaformis CCMP3155]